MFSERGNFGPQVAFFSEEALGEGPGGSGGPKDGDASLGPRGPST